MTFDFVKEIENINRHRPHCFAIEVPDTGYKISIDKLDKKSKSYSIYVCEKGTNVYKKVGLVRNPELLKKAFEK